MSDESTADEVALTIQHENRYNYFVSATNERGEVQMLAHDKKYNVKKSDLLTKLKENREKHVKEFKDAAEKYRAAVIVALEKELKRVQAGKKFTLAFRLPRPTSYEKDYDKVIGLLELTTDDIIEITPSDYEHYWLDNWNWKTSFSNTNAQYSGAASDSSDDDDVGSEA